MALELRPKKTKPGQPQKWVARFQIPTGKRSESGKLIYKNHAETIGERGAMRRFIEIRPLQIGGAWGKTVGEGVNVRKK
ncbi:MAG: hypothetical protein WD000_10970 [Thermodesulfobacteriota bacterium]